MAKVGWRTKAMYVLFALALVVGLSVALVPAQPAAKAEVPESGTFIIDSGVVGCGTAGNVTGYFTGSIQGIEVGPYYAQMTAITIDVSEPANPLYYTGQIGLKMWIGTGPGGDRIDFNGEYIPLDHPPFPTTVIVGPGVLTIHDPLVGDPQHQWDYRPVNVELDYGGVELRGARTLAVTMDGNIGVPQLLPDIALDVKGSIQKFILVNVPLYTPVIPIWAGGLTQQQFANWIENLGLQAALDVVQALWNPREILQWKLISGVMLDSSDIDIVGGGQLGDPFIEIRSGSKGDIHPAVTLLWPYYLGAGLESLYEVKAVEKKWGDIDHTILDLNPELATWSPVHPPGMPPFDEDPLSWDVEVRARAGTLAQPEYEWFSDFIYAWYYWGSPEIKNVDTAGRAIVHWWLIEDDDEGLNEQAILDIMEYLNTYDGDGDGLPDVEPLVPGSEPQGLGLYAAAPAPKPEEMIDAVWEGTPLVYAPLGIDLDPAVPDDVTLNGADFTTFTNLVDGFYYLQNLGTKMTTVAQDDFPFETRGLSMALTSNVGVESILVVTLSEYPMDFHGENPVCVEMGWKRYGPVPEVEEVKTPQLRWAGEKIVLEKDWSDVIAGELGAEFIVVYHLEGQSVGEISPAGGSPSYEGSEGDIWVAINPGTDLVTEVILESEVQGEADVNAKLYRAEGWTLIGEPLVNYGFLVYFMAFEDVTLAEDITPQVSLEALQPETGELVGEDADVAVQVRGWFTSAALPGTDREAVDVDGDHVYELPAGRYVMPDDWWALANHNFDLRPNMDLMDRAHSDAIAADSSVVGTDWIGPFDTGVRTILEPAEAQRPTIGPFSTLQPWSTELMWIAARSAPTSHDGFAFRNTVVPDGEMSWHDAPMPQGLVIFDVQPASDPDAALTDLLKRNLGPKAGMAKGYGYTGTPKVYESPFYEIEIPSHWLIPDHDYDWGSWNFTAKNLDPYPLWTDLFKKSVGDQESGIGTPTLDINPKDLEVYCDNHGIAAVTIEALDSAGTVTLVATAEYPAALKKGKYGPVSSDDIVVTWGAVDLNPHFLADDRDVDVEEVITFSNETTGGNLPYVKAEWDFDYIPPVPEFDLTLELPGDDPVDQDVTWSYLEPGVYSVALQMTDSADVTRLEYRPLYITVGGAVPTVVWEMPNGLDVDPAAVNMYLYRLDAVAVTLADVADTIPADVSVIWNYAGTAEGWKWFRPGWPESTLTMLQPGNYYIGIALSATEWEIPQA